VLGDHIEFHPISFLFTLSLENFPLLFRALKKNVFKRLDFDFVAEILLHLNLLPGKNVNISEFRSVTSLCGSSH
jgi:hypothetical protein